MEYSGSRGLLHKFLGVPLCTCSSLSHLPTYSLVVSYSHHFSLSLGSNRFPPLFCLLQVIIAAYRKCHIWQSFFSHLLVYSLYSNLAFLDQLTVVFYMSDFLFEVLSVFFIIIKPVFRIRIWFRIYTERINQIFIYKYLIYRAIWKSITWASGAQVHLLYTIILIGVLSLCV